MANKLRKAVFVFLLIFSFVFFVPSQVKSQTIEELQARIQDLLKRIAQLQEEVQRLGGVVQVKPPWCHDFSLNLRYGDSGSEVSALHTALEKEGFEMSSSEVSRSYFGDFTASAVVGFQEKYRDEILSPWGLKYGTGYVGRTTRAKLNKLYGCSPEFKNLPPVIDGVSGPTQLKVGEKGIWTIKAHDPERGSLSYSVVWGDEGTGLRLPPFAEKFVQTATFSHIYSKAGIYAVRFTVKDDKGATANTSITVRVVEVKKEELSVRITSPQDGEEVSGVITVKVSASGPSPITKVSLEYFKTSSLSAELVTLTDCASAVAMPENGYGPIYFEYCSYNLDTSPYSGTNLNLRARASDSAGRSGVSSLVTLKVSKEISALIKVISPNGGEKWLKGTTQQIRWETQDSLPSGVIDIDLTSWAPPCNGELCPLMPAVRSYSIAKDLRNTGFFNWEVGKDIKGNSIPNGKYLVKVSYVVKDGLVYRDTSDSFFTIASSVTQNHPPVITSVPSIPEFVLVGQTVNFAFSAQDPDGDGLSWSVSWGDGTGATQACPASNTNAQNTWNFKTSHAWNKAGSYTVKVRVSDCRGGEDNYTINVVVRSSTDKPDLVIEDIDLRLASSNEYSCPAYKYTVYVKNIGSAPANLSKLRVTLYPPQTQRINNCTDFKLTQGFRASIPNNDLVKGDVLLPNQRERYFDYFSPTAPGYITISAVADEFNEVSELNENNNFRGERFYVKSLFTPSSITVLSPNGGEKWARGKTYPIKWSSQGDIQGIELYYWNKEKESQPLLIARLSTNPGVYNWKIPEDFPVGKYVILVKSSSNPEILDQSDNVFTIGDEFVCGDGICSQNFVHLLAGESASVSDGFDNYTVSVRSISSDSAVIVVNNESKTVKQGVSYKIAGLDIYVMDMSYYSPGSEGGVSSVTLLAGPESMLSCSQDCSPQACYSSDGKNYYKRGRTIQGAFGYFESCSEENSFRVVYNRTVPVLNEYWCQDGQVQSVRFTCPNGCFNGACIEPIELQAKQSTFGKLQKQLADISSAARELIKNLQKILSK